MEFVDGAGPEYLRVSQADELGSAESERVKSRDARSALLAGIGVVEVVVVEEIVARKSGPIGRVGVDSPGGFIVAHRLRKGRGGKLIGAHIGRGNVVAADREPATTMRSWESPRSGTRCE